jgi:O-antigen/teichoic acid export membrane protein
LKASYLAGSFWSGLNAAAALIVPLGLFVFFAREIPPWQIGVVAYSLAWVEIVKVCLPLGLYEALLAVEDYEAYARPAAGLLMAAAVVGLAVHAGIMLAAPLWLPAAAKLTPFILVLGLKIVFDVLLVQPDVVLARRLDFRRLASRTLLANFGSAAFAIGIGRFTPPLVGLVSYYVLQSVVVWVTTVLGTGSLLAPSLGWGRLRGIARTAFLASQVRSLGALNNFADQVIAGSFIPPAALARYNLGKRLEVAQITASQSFATILFQPLFARRRDEDIAREYQRSLFMITALLGVPTAVLVANIDTIIPLAFGARWAAAAPIAAALAISGFARAVGNVHGAYFSVSGKNAALRNRALVSALSGIAIVSLTGVVGLFCVSVLIALKNALMTAWSAWMTRNLAPLSYYVKDVMGLPVIAVAAALSGRWFGGLWWPVHSVMDTLMVWSVSVAICALVVCALYLGETVAAVKSTLKFRQA